MGSKKAKSVGISGGFAPTDLYCFRAVLYQSYPPIIYGSLNVIQPDVRILKSAFRERGYARQPNLAERVRWIVEQTTQLTGLFRFGQYLTLLFEADMLFGNEDRHLNNIAVLLRGEDFGYCPLFDFGAGLLSNTRDYPLDIEPRAHLRLLRALPLGTTFGRQVQAARAVYGPQLEWAFTADDIANALARPLEFYAQRDRVDIVDPVTVCIQMQANKQLPR